MPFTKVQDKPNRKKFRIWQLNNGFTLIELLVVISIIAILVAAATASWTTAQKKARDNKRKSDLKSLQQALELYFQTNGTYPDSSGGKIKCAVVGTGADPNPVKNWGKDFTCNTITFINPLPQDPRGVNEYYYYSYQHPISDVNKFLKYQISAALENNSDPDYCTASDTCSNLPCAPNDLTKSNGAKSYCVIQP